MLYSYAMNRAIRHTHNVCYLTVQAKYAFTLLPIAQLPRLKKETCAYLAENTHSQRALRWVCGERSQGWRSALSEPRTGSLREEQT